MKKLKVLKISKQEREVLNPFQVAILLREAGAPVKEVEGRIENAGTLFRRDTEDGGMEIGWNDYSGN